MACVRDDGGGSKPTSFVKSCAFRRAPRLSYAEGVSTKSRSSEAHGKPTLTAVRGIDLLHARYAVGEALLSSATVDAKQVEGWTRATSETLQRVFGEDTAAAEFSNVEGSDVTSDESDESATRFRLQKRMAMLEGLILRAEELYAEPLAARATAKRVYLAPGRNETMCQAVIDFLESIERSPIVQGRAGEPESAIEALERHQDVGFAIVMLTNEAGSGAANDALLELGFLLGKLGRGRVCVVESEPMADRRYDESVVRVELDDRGEWQDSVVKALREAGIT